MNIVIAIIILLGYTIALCIKGGGVLSSLSASVFELPKGKRWIWTLMLFAVCFLCVPTYVEVTSESTRFIAFIAIAALAFVGAAPLVADKTPLLGLKRRRVDEANLFLDKQRYYVDSVGNIKKQ